MSRGRLSCSHLLARLLDAGLALVMRYHEMEVGARNGNNESPTYMNQHED
jgi:hypothetical protein